MSTFPILILNPHSRCNCRCVMCDIWKADAVQELGAADLEGIGELGVRWVVLSGGEPLMHSDLFGLCRKLRHLDVRITLLSTGLLLKRNAREIDEYIDDVIVSIDGPPPIHNAIRRLQGAFETMAEGVASLEDTPVSGRCTVQRLNAGSLCETVRAAQGIGLNSISFLAADVTSNAFNRPDGWPVDRQSQIAPDLEMLEREIEALIAMDSSFVRESPEKLRRISGQFRDPTAPRCNAPWVSAVVEPDGTVRPCFFHEPIGNVHDGGLQQVLTGPRATAFRAGLDVATDPICRRCVCSLYHV
jgi:MoaA/NifB/PqqE/SkfB family radical SAM enzyme